MKLGALLDQLARDLNDAALGHEFTAWSREQLWGYLTEGAAAALAVRTDVFQARATVLVEPGQDWQAVCGCQYLTPESVLGQSTAEGRILKTLQVRDSAAPRWTGPVCPGSRPFRLRSVTIGADHQSFLVSPPVPAGEEVYLTFNCSSPPENIDESLEVEAPMAAALTQWVLYRARMVDAEVSPASMAAAGVHKNAFYELLNLKNTLKATEVRLRMAEAAARKAGA